MNILIIGKPSADLVDLIKNSKYADKIYTALNKDYTDLPNIEYRNYDELIEKALALKIDIALNINANAIVGGITEAFEQSKVNLISVNQKWFNLESSRISAKKLLQHYNINTPQDILIPLTFPVMIKTDEPKCNYIVYTMKDMVLKMEELEGEKTFYEECIAGEPYTLHAIWDKKNIKYFRNTDSLTEVQKDRLELLETKLNFMFSDENADFTGIFAVNLVWYKNDWYVNSFDMCPDISADNFGGTDFVYVLNSAIYQKLGEI